MNRIKTQRSLLGWTQERAAQEIGVTLRTYSRYELGKAPARALKMMDMLVDKELNLLSRACAQQPSHP